MEKAPPWGTRYRPFQMMPENEERVHQSLVCLLPEGLPSLVARQGEHAKPGSNSSCFQLSLLFFGRAVQDRASS
jgi:hypothetical protein